MLIISFRTKFKKELLLQKKRGKDLGKFLDIADKLAKGETLDAKYCNHKLIGKNFNSTLQLFGE